MRIRILGSAAGGGLPQWNCRCANCEAVRANSPDVRPRTQSSVAVSADDRLWFLLNVSADVRQQLRDFASLWPPEGNPRGTTVAGCLLTDAEIDHTSGLLQLREGCRFPIFSTALVRRWLSRYLPLGPILSGFADRPWIDLPLATVVPLPTPTGDPSGLCVRVLTTGEHAPRFVPEDTTDLAGSVAAFEIEEKTSGAKLLYAPGVSTMDGAFQEAGRRADCIFIDGTFWTDDEPIQSGISDKTACQMGHLPVDGPRGTLAWLTDQPARHRAFVHINNTNPMLNERGTEYQKVNDCGVRVGSDGDEFDV